VEGSPPGSEVWWGEEPHAEGVQDKGMQGTASLAERVQRAVPTTPGITTKIYPVLQARGREQLRDGPIPQQLQVKAAAADLRAGDEDIRQPLLSSHPFPPCLSLSQVSLLSHECLRARQPAKTA